MKNLLTILFLLFSTLLFSQNPDTLIVELSTTDTLPNGEYGLLIGKGIKNKNNDKLNIVWEDDLFDSLGVAEYAQKAIDNGERLQAQSDQLKFEGASLKKLYAPANSLMIAYSGTGIVARTRQLYGARYVGYYSISSGGQKKFYRFDLPNIVTEVLRDGSDAPSGEVGTFKPVRDNRFLLNGVQGLTSDTPFTKFNDGSRLFLSVDSDLRVRKIR